MADEAWTAGEAYEAYIGRWSRRVAEAFLRWLDVPPWRHWLDLGCGTGALSATVLAKTNPTDVVGIDSSANFVTTARGGITDPRARFALGDARSLPLRTEQIDVAVSGLALNFVPDPGRAAAELARVTKPGGLGAAYVWDYAEGMAMLRHFWDAAVALDPAAAEQDEGRRFPLCRSEPLAKLWTDAGWEQVRVRALDVPTVFVDFDDFWLPFLGGQGPAPGYLKSLSDEQGATLRELLRSRLPAGPGRTIPLTARAWAVRGSRPQWRTAPAETA